MPHCTLTTVTQDLSSYRKGVLLVLFAGLLWSFIGIGIRLIDSDNGWQISFYRAVGMIPPLLMAIALRNRGRVLQAFYRIGRTGIIAGLCLGVSFVANVYAMLNTSVANVVFIGSSTTFFAALLGWILLREGVRRQTWFALTFVMIGISVMLGTSLTLDGLKGMLFAFVMVTSYAVSTVAIRRGKNIDMLPAICLSGFFSLILSGIMVSDFILSQKDLMLCLGIGAGPIGLGLILFTFGSKHVQAAELTMLGMIEVVLSPLWVWIGVDEQPGTWSLLGGAIILFGLMVQATGAQRKTFPPPTICSRGGEHQNFQQGKKSL